MNQPIILLRKADRYLLFDGGIPLNIGGAPDDPRNLWPQPRNSQWNAERKDGLELRLYNLVCDGKVPLVEAQKAYATDWIAAYKKYVGR